MQADKMIFVRCVHIHSYFLLLPAHPVTITGPVAIDVPYVGGFAPVRFRLKVQSTRLHTVGIGQVGGGIATGWAGKSKK